MKEETGYIVFRYKQAGYRLKTVRQLRAVGLRPTADPVAEIRWRRGDRVAYLYDPAAAVPVRPMTPGMWRAHEAMMRARRTCPICLITYPYCIPTSLKSCPPCADRPVALAA
ncbi:RRQRL motif-containing zinc-binding protein [Streptomyces niveus]|uniref:RRQRL motif-containing zinc-binding protein n=1 Tax=Streptomyces niveus TaxID=193462 RepID=UPI0003C5CFC9|nr:RRQRL motif-containing zinc-binding protein [Streptomyces niveus]EST17859.1 hypothetical protein M877_40080 [Streptomyces niveus NCIMB 11891]